MPKANVQFTKDNEYYTPKSFVEYFGKFDYDPATTKEKAEEFWLINYDTIETNWLEKDWTQFKRIWINPPFTIKHEFLKKASDTYRIAKNEIYILFPIEFLTTKRFYSNFQKWTVYIPNGRICFESWLWKKWKSPAFWSVVFKLSDNWEVIQLNLDYIL